MDLNSRFLLLPLCGITQVNLKLYIFSWIFKKRENMYNAKICSSDICFDSVMRYCQLKPSNFNSEVCIPDLSPAPPPFLGGGGPEPHTL